MPKNLGNRQKLVRHFVYYQFFVKKRSNNGRCGTATLSITAILLFVTTGFRCDQATLAIALLMSANAAIALLVPGSMKSMVLIGGAANAGVVGSVSALLIFGANIPLPYLVAFIVADKSQASWNRAYQMAAGISLFGAMTFSIIGSGDLQKWVDDDLPHGSKVQPIQSDDVNLDVAAVKATTD